MPRKGIKQVSVCTLLDFVVSLGTLMAFCGFVRCQYGIYIVNVLSTCAGDRKRDISLNTAQTD